MKKDKVKKARGESDNMTDMERVFLAICKDVMRKKPSTEPEEHQKVRAFIDLVKSAKNVEAADPKSKYATEQRKDLEVCLRNTLGCSF